MELLDPMSVAAMACVDKATHAAVYHVYPILPLSWPAPTEKIMAHGCSDRDILYYLRKARVVARAKLALDFDHIGRFRFTWHQLERGDMKERIASYAIREHAAECLAHIMFEATSWMAPKWHAVTSHDLRRDILAHVPFAIIKKWFQLIYKTDLTNALPFMLHLLENPISLGKQREFFRVAYKAGLSEYSPTLALGLAQYLEEDMAAASATNLRSVLRDVLGLSDKANPDASSDADEDKLVLDVVYSSDDDSDIMEVSDIE